MSISILKCDCDLTGGCEKCNPHYKIFNYVNFTYAVMQGIIVKVYLDELNKNNFIWSDKDKSPEYIVVEAEITNEKLTRFLPK